MPAFDSTKYHHPTVTSTGMKQVPSWLPDGRPRDVPCLQSLHLSWARISPGSRDGHLYISHESWANYLWLVVDLPPLWLIYG